MEWYSLIEEDMANLQANIVSLAERESLMEQEVIHCEIFRKIMKPNVIFYRTSW